MIAGLLLFAGFAFAPGRPADISAATGETGTRDREPARLRPGTSGESTASGNDWPGRWLTAAPDKTGFDPEPLDRSVRRIGEMDGVYSVLVVRRGRLVVERYFREGYREKPHNMKSASKSLISALVGIAVDEGRMGLDQPIQELLPYKTIFEDPEKQRITVRHLLTMTSGLVPTSYQAYNTMIAESDWVEAALRRPMNAAPGTRFQYSTGDAHILSGILTAVTGMSTRAYAEKMLFGPLGITVQGWDRDPSGVFMGGNNLSLFPRDMAKLGLLYLDGGSFGRRQVLPREWVRESTLPREDGDNEIYGRYGYLWYTRPGGEEAFVAVGFGGQYIYVSPPDDCVIVITSTLESKGHAWEKTLFRLLQGGILGSLDGHPKRTPASVAASSPEDPVVAPGKDTLRPISRGRTTANLALRNVPGTDGTRLALVPREAEVPIFQTADGWHRIRYRGRPGWIYGGYVEILALEPVEGESLPQAPRAARTTSRLNLRGGPGETHPVLMTLVPDSPLIVTSQTGKWLHVRAGDRKGWVYGPYVRISPLSGEKTVRQPSAPEGLTPQKQAAAVPDNARSAPIEVSSGSEKRIGTLPRAPSDGKDRVRAVEAGTEQMRLALENQRRETTKYRAEKNRLTSDLISANEKIRTLEEEIRIARAGRSAVETDLHRLRREAASTTRTAEASQTALKTLSAKLSDAQAREQTLAATIDTLRNDGKTLRATVARLREELDAAKRRETLEVSMAREGYEKDRAAADSRIAALNGSLREATEGRNRLQAELAGLRGDLAALRDALSEKEKKIEGAAVARASLEKDLAALRRELANRAEKSAIAQSELSARLAETEKKLERERRSAGQAREAAGTLSGQLSSAREEIGKLAQTLEKERREKETLKDALVSSQKDLIEKDRQTIEASKARKALEKDLASSRARIATREKTLTEALNRRDVLAGEVMGLREEIVHLRQEAEIAAERQTALSDAFDAAVEELRSAKGALQTARNDKAALNRELAALRERLDRSVPVRKALEAELVLLRRETSAQVAASQKDRSRLRFELAFLERELESVRVVAEQSDRERKILSQELAASKSQIEGLVKSLEASRSDQEKLKTVVAKLGKDLAAERAAARESSSDRSRLERDLASSRSRLSVLEKTLKERSDAGDRLEAVVAGQKKALEAQRQAVAESGAARQKLLNDLQTATGRVEKRDRALEAAGRDREKLERSVSALRRALTVRSRAAAASSAGQKSLENRLTESREQQARLADKLATSTARQQEMAARMVDLQTELERQRAAAHGLAATAQNLTAALTDARNRIDSLTPKINDSRQKVRVTQRMARASDIAGKSLNTSRTDASAKVRKEFPPQREIPLTGVAASSGTTPRPVHSESIDAFVRSWALAWSKKDADAYLSHYSTSFRPRGSLTLEAWRNRRQERIARPAFIEVSVLNLSAEMVSPDTARVSFHQSYRSDTYGDRVLKILDLVREDGRWKIAGEISRHIAP